MVGLMSFETIVFQSGETESRIQINLNTNVHMNIFEYGIFDV